MKSKFIALILVFLSLNGICQVHKGFRWIGPDHFMYSIDHDSGFFRKESPQKQKSELGKIKDWEIVKKELPGDFDINAFYQNDTSILITIPGTGQLYQFYPAELQFNRLDRTFFRGYNFNAAQFSRNDTLFSIGGEGFWQQHSVITFYNSKTQEWDSYPSVNKNLYPTTASYSGYSPEYDLFFSVPLQAERILAKEDSYFSSYSFKEKKWDIKGKVTTDLLDYAKNKLRSVWTGKYLILFPQDGRGSGDIRLLEPFENKLFQYNVTDNQFFTQNCEVYYSNGYLFSRNLVSAGRSDKSFFDSLSVDSIVKQSKQIGEVYESEFINSTQAVILLLGFVLLVSFFAYRMLRARKQQFELSEQEKQVLQSLTQKQAGEKLSSSALNNLLQIGHKSYDNQRQIRNRVIQTINQKLYNSFGSKELILRSYNSEDKRMMDYYINPDINTKDLYNLLK